MPEIPRVFALQTFSRESLRHSHFAIKYLVCSTERKQTTTQREKNVVRMWAAVSLGERCLTSQKTAVEETKPSSAKQQREMPKFCTSWSFINHNLQLIPIDSTFYKELIVDITNM